MASTTLLHHRDFRIGAYVMNLKPKLVVLILTASAIVVLTTILLIPEQRRLDKVRNDQAEPSASTNTIPPESPDSPGNPALKAPTVGGPKPSIKPADVEINYISELLARADSGDPAAQFEAYLELGRCSGLETYSKVQLQIDTASELGTPYADEFVDYLWSMHDKCASIPLEDLRQSAWHYLSLAQQANHPAAVALQLNDIATNHGFDAADDLALQILQSNDPAAILNTAPYLLSRRSTLPLEQQQLTRSPEILKAALDIWACNLDSQSCGPGSMTMYLNCYKARQPNCDVNEGYLDYLSHAVWSQDIEAEARQLASKWQSEVEEGKTPSILAGETE